MALQLELAVTSLLHFPFYTTHHSGCKLQQFLLGILNSLRVTFNTDQVAFLVIRGDSHQDFVLILNAIYLEKPKKQTTLRSIDPGTREFLQSVIQVMKYLNVVMRGPEESTTWC